MASNDSLAAKNQQQRSSVQKPSVSAAAKLLNISKMHGAGNDFVVFDARYGLWFDLPAFARAACDRRFGIGADGIIALGVSDKADFRMTYLNADGSPSICGNGLRCLAKYIVSKGLHEGRKNLDIETDTSVVSIEIIGKGDWFRVDMGQPMFEGTMVPTTEPGRHLRRELTAAGMRVFICAVGMGNPHCIIFVEDLDKAPFDTLGPALELHPFFPAKTNVEFVQVLSRSLVQVRVWERGVGETLACGTGACAVLAACAQTGRTERSAQLNFRGGQFYGQWLEGTDRIQLTGPAEEVFGAAIDVERLLLAKEERMAGAVPSFVTSALAAG